MKQVYIDHNLSGEEPYGWAIESRPSDEWILNEVSPSHCDRKWFLTWHRENKRIYDTQSSAFNAFEQMSKPVGEGVSSYFANRIFRIVPLYSKSSCIDKDPLGLNALVIEPPLSENQNTNE
jgi:hypothetical protein